MDLREGGAVELAGKFCGGVGRKRTKRDFVFAERHATCGAIDAAGRAEDQTLDTKFAAELENVERAADVGLLVGEGIRDRGTHAGARGEMNQDFGLRLLECFAEARLIADVDLVKIESADFGDRGEIPALPFRRIKGIEIINDGKLRTAFKQSLGKMRADEAGSACEEDAFSGFQQVNRSRVSVGRASD